MQEHIFVYGTLKTGQCRAHQWPLRPLHIRKAWTLGRLYDTGPYPAMLCGQDRIAGQVWSFHAADMENTFQVLDRIEGTNQPGQPNQYDREQVLVYLNTGESLVASTYLYSRAEFLPKFAYLAPTLRIGDDEYAIWPPASPW